METQKVKCVRGTIATVKGEKTKLKVGKSYDLSFHEAKTLSLMGKVELGGSEETETEKTPAKENAKAGPKETAASK